MRIEVSVCDSYPHQLRGRGQTRAPGRATMAFGSSATNPSDGPVAITRASNGIEEFQDIGRPARYEVLCRGRCGRFSYCNAAGPSKVAGAFRGAGSSGRRRGR